MKVREGYRIWHDHTFADDALQAPRNTEWFGGWSMGAGSDSHSMIMNSLMDWPLEDGTIQPIMTLIQQSTLV